jgi:hypothetical protein
MYADPDPQVSTVNGKAARNKAVGAFQSRPLETNHQIQVERKGVSIINL